MSFGQHLGSKQHPSYVITNTYKKSIALYSYYVWTWSLFTSSVSTVLVSRAISCLLYNSLNVSLYMACCPLLTTSLWESGFFLPFSFLQPFFKFLTILCKTFKDTSHLVISYFLSYLSPLCSSTFIYYSLNTSIAWGILSQGVSLLILSLHLRFYSNAVSSVRPSVVPYTEQSVLYLSVLLVYICSLQNAYLTGCHILMSLLSH